MTVLLPPRHCVFGHHQKRTLQYQPLQSWGPQIHALLSKRDDANGRWRPLLRLSTCVSGPRSWPFRLMSPMAWTLSRYRSLRVVGPVVGPAGSAGQAWRFPLPTPQDPQKGSEESEICVLHVPTAFYLPKKETNTLIRYFGRMSKAPTCRWMLSATSVWSPG